MARTAKRDYTRQQQLAHGPVDLPFLGLTILLLGIGLIMLLSASSYTASIEADSHYDAAYYFKQQFMYAILGLVAMYVISRIDYQWLRKLAAPLLMLALLLLVLVLIPHVGVNRNNATRWLQLFIKKGPTYQPSEIAKVAVILMFSAYLDRWKRTKKNLKVRYRQPIEGLRRFYYWSDLDVMWPLIVILLVIGILMLKEPHLSGVILIYAAAAAVLFAAGIRLFWFIVGGVGVAGGVWFMLKFVGYNSKRIEVWKDPWNPNWIQDDGYQIVQSIYAVASGGLSGLGLGLSRQKYGYLPEEQNDVIFAVVCEELGFIGAAIIIALFALLVIRGYWLAIHARDRFGSMIIVGITTLLAVQVFLNIAVVTNLIPCTGISLPFFSYGGTALVTQLMEMGIVLSVSRQIAAPAED